ncbi:hypothetical protein PM082_021775 [Marasmius tenuissimus]|nr:hypothetical protein PM082_021775 [Marasmius tenuissimus]
MIPAPVTESNPSLCQVQPCGHKHASCLESSKFESDSLNPGHTLADPETSQLKGLARDQEREVIVTNNSAVQKYCSAKSIRQTVPAEIWDTIFRQSIDDYSFSLRHHTLDPLALTFSHVCARWRAVVIGNPSLWSSISIDLSSFTSEMTVALQIYLKLSEGCLLNLRIYLSGDPTELGGNARGAWRLLGPHLSRCRALVWHVDNAEIVPEVHGLVFSNLVSFKDGSVRLHSLDEMALSPDWFWAAIRSAPRLTRVVVESPLPLRWLSYSRLTSLDVQYIGRVMVIETLFHVLPNCSCLVSLTLGSPDIDGDDLLPLAFLEPIEIPSLRHLTVDDEHVPIYSFNEALSVLCSHLRLPNLTSCSVSACEWPSPVSRLLQNCSDTLERLEINLSPFRPDDASLDPIITLLHHTPHLAQLELSVSKLDGSSFEATSVALFLSQLRSPVEPDGNPYLPRLQSLHLQYPGLEVTTAEVEMVLDVATKRSAADTTCALSRLRLASAGSYTLNDPAHVKRVRELREHGFWVIFDDC